jgi:hypothetical protein
MPATAKSVEIPKQVLDYLYVHHVLTIATCTFTGMPHGATVPFASSPSGVYFAMDSNERTAQNIDANHYASFTVDDYTPDFRKVRELRGVGRCARVDDATEIEQVRVLFADKLPEHDNFAGNLHRITPVEVHFVDFEYSEGVAVPRESNIVYAAAPEAAAMTAGAVSAQLEHLQFAPGEVIVHQGARSNRFFIIVDGEVEVRREGHGQDVVVTRHQSGQFFGEVGAFTGEPQTATFVAVVPTTVLAIDRSSLQDFVSQSAAADLGQRLRSTLDQLGQQPPTA